MMRAAILAGLLLAAPALGVGRSFDGTDDVVTSSDATSLRPSALTLSCWAKTTSAETFAGMMDKFEGSVAGYMLDVPGSDGKPRIAVRVSGADRVVTSLTAANSGAWRMISGTYGGSNCRIFRDGTQNNSASCTGTVQHDTHGVKLGGDGASTNFMTVILADCRIYNRALPEIEHKWIFHGSPYVIGGLVYWLALDERGSATSYTDRSGKGNHGTCTNCPAADGSSGGPWIRYGIGQ